MVNLCGQSGWRHALFQCFVGVLVRRLYISWWKSGSLSGLRVTGHLYGIECSSKGSSSLSCVEEVSGELVMKDLELPDVTAVWYPSSEGRESSDLTRTTSSMRSPAGRLLDKSGVSGLSVSLVLLSVSIVRMVAYGGDSLENVNRAWRWKLRRHDILVSLRVEFDAKQTKALTHVVSLQIQLGVIPVVILFF